MRVIRTFFLILTFCCVVSFNSFAQNSNESIGHIKFDLSQNEKVVFTNSITGYIDLFEKFVGKTSGEKIFNIKRERFLSICQKEVKKEIIDSISFLTIDKMITAWEKSDFVIRTNVFKKIYLYEILKSNSVIRHEVVWEEVQY
jgi:hypothetical protein